MLIRIEICECDLKSLTCYVSNFKFEQVLWVQVIKNKGINVYDLIVMKWDRVYTVKVYHNKSQSQFTLLKLDNKVFIIIFTLDII